MARHYRPVLSYSEQQTWKEGRLFLELPADDPSFDVDLSAGVPRWARQPVGRLQWFINPRYYQIVASLLRLHFGVFVNSVPWEKIHGFDMFSYHRDVGKQGWQQLLQVQAGAPFEAVRASFRALIKEHHPDKGGSTEFAQQLVEAWELARAYYSGVR